VFVEKVAAFVTRDRDDPAGRREFLVFRHDNPAAGIQVPAGTVEPGESPREAVLREVAEEAGLTGLIVVGEPKRAPLELRDDEWYLALNHGGRETIERLELARPIVRIKREETDRVLLEGEVWTGGSVEWWASRTTITRDVRRSLFHLQVTDRLPDRWERAFDRPQPWVFYWVPVEEEPPLVGRQSQWLALMRPQLLDSSNT
jgi:8-oxo-dGTP pyrophosphatase MutT (NUDIX family)